MADTLVEAISYLRLDAYFLDKLAALYSKNIPGVRLIKIVHTSTYLMEHRLIDSKKPTQTGEDKNCYIDRRYDVYNTRVKFDKMSGSAIANEVATALASPHTDRADVIEYYLLALVSSERKPSQQQEIFANQKLCDDIIATLRALPDEMMRNFYSQLLLMLKLGKDKRALVDDQAHTLAFCENRLAILNNPAFVTSLYLKEFYIEVLNQKLLNITNPEFNERLIVCFNIIKAHYDRMYFRTFEVTMKITDSKRLCDLVELSPEDSVAVYVPPGVKLQPVNAKEMVVKYFELANATLRSNNNDSLLSLYKEFESLPWQQPLLIEKELASEGSLLKARLRQMRLLVKLLFNTKLKREEKECKAIAEYLSDVNVDKSENGLIYLLGVYIKLTARISSTFYEDDAKALLVLFRSIVHMQHRMTVDKDKLMFTYSASFNKEFCNEMRNGSSKAFQIFNSRIMIALVQRMLVLRKRLNDQIPGVRDFEERNLFERVLQSIDVLLTRVRLDGFTDVQQFLKTHIDKHSLECCTDILNSSSEMDKRLPRLVTATHYGRLQPEQVKLALKLLSNKLHIAEAAFSAMFYFNTLPFDKKAELKGYFKSHLYDLLFDLENVQQDIEYWIKKGELSAVELNHSELIKSAVCYYAHCSGFNTHEHERSIINFDFNNIKFNEYFSGKCSRSMSLILCEQVNLRIRTGVDRMTVITNMSATITYLLNSLETCPESEKYAAKRAIIQYYLFCLTIVKNSELAAIKPHEDAVLKLLDDDVHRYYIQVMMKMTGDEKEGEALKHTTIDGVISMVMLLVLMEEDFSKLALSAWERQRFLTLIQGMITYVMRNQTDGDIAQLDLCTLNQYLVWHGKAVAQSANDFIYYYIDTTRNAKCAELVEVQEKKKTNKEKKPVKPAVDTQQVILLLCTTLSADAERHVEGVAEPVASRIATVPLDLPAPSRAVVIKMPEQPKATPVVSGTLDMYKHLVGPRLVKDTLLCKRVNPFHVMLKDFNLRVSALQGELVTLLKKHQINAYIFGDTLVSALYEKAGKSLSVLCCASVEDMLEMLTSSGLKEELLVTRIANDVLRLIFKNPAQVSDCRISLHCSTNPNVEDAMNDLRMRECFNTTFFYEINTGSIIDVTKQYFNQIIVYPKVHFNANNAVSPCIEINRDLRLSRYSTAEIILNAFSYLVRFSDNTMVVGAKRLHGFITNNLHSLPASEKVSLVYFDDIFVVKRGRMAVNWLHYYSGVGMLFPFLKSEYINDFYIACELVDKSSARIHERRTTFFATLVYHSFVSTIPNWEYFAADGRGRFDEALRVFISSTPFAISDSKELMEDICKQVWNRYSSDLVNAQYQFFIKLRKSRGYQAHEKKEFVTDYCEHMKSSNLSVEAVTAVANLLWRHHVSGTSLRVARQ